MKLKYLFISIIAIAALYFTSCKKDNINDDDTTTNPILIDSPYLSKVYWIDYETSANIKTLIRTYNYDSNKRVLGYTDSTQFGVIAKSQYFYSASEVAPYKSVVIIHNPFPRHYNSWGIIDTSYFTFENGKRKKDSIIRTAIIGTPGFRNSIIVKNYTHGVNKIYAIGSQKRYFTNGNIESQYTMKDSANINLNGAIDSSKSYISEDFTSGNLRDTIRSYFKYDNRQSPFAFLSNNIVGDIFVTKGIYNHEIYFDQFVQSNNIISSTIYKKSNAVNYVAFWEDFVGKYTYKSNGLPLKIEDFSTNSNTLRYQIKFTYTKL